MNAAQPELDFGAVAESIAGETRATVELVGEDWLGLDWDRFYAIVNYCAEPDGTVDPNYVREHFLDDEGHLQINPRRYSAFWHRAASKTRGFLDADGWVTNTDHAGGNAGKPLRRYRLRAGA